MCPFCKKCVEFDNTIKGQYCPKCNRYIYRYYHKINKIDLSHLPTPKENFKNISRNDHLLGLVQKKNDEIIENNPEKPTLNEGNTHLSLLLKDANFHFRHSRLGRLRISYSKYFHNIRFLNYDNNGYRFYDYIENDNNDIVDCERDSLSVFCAVIGNSNVNKFYSRSDLREFECAMPLLTDIKEVPEFFQKCIWRGTNRYEQPLEVFDNDFKNFFCHFDRSHGFWEFEIKYYNRDGVIDYYREIEKIDRIIECINYHSYLFPTIYNLKEEIKNERILRAKGIITIPAFLIELYNSEISESLEYNHGHLINNSVSYNDILFNKIDYENFG